MFGYSELDGNLTINVIENNVLLDDMKLCIRCLSHGLDKIQQRNIKL